MLSEEQERIKREKILLVVKIFLSSNKTINEISLETGISSSSVQRYLNEERIIGELFGNEVNEVISAKLKRNTDLGVSRGGKITQSRYKQTRDENGKYTGFTKK